MTTSIKPMDVIMELDLLSWPVLAVGLNHDWATQTDIIKFAESQLMRDALDPNKLIARLAWSESMSVNLCSDIVLEIIREKDGLLGTDYARALKVWQLAHLIVAEQQSTSPDDLLEKAAEIYGQFGFPSDMWLTSRYNLTVEDRENIRVGLPAHDPVLAVRDVIRTLKEELLFSS